MTTLPPNLFVRLLLLSALTLMSSAYGAETVRIGVLAYRPKPQTLAQWQPLAAVLKQAMPEYDFVVQALSYPELNEAVARRQLNFVLTNPGHYILLTRRGGVSAPLATLELNEHGRPVTEFGGVIFCRAGHAPIDTLGDIKGKTIAITNADSLGGYQMQAYELLQAGIKLPQHAKLLPLGMPHDTVVDAVLTGRAEIGFVRSGVLEDLAEEGRLDMAQINILNRQYLPDFPVQASTRLYPEWPFAALPQTDEKLARHVAAALFLLEKDTAALRAMHIFGFAVPADYIPVADLLKELRLPPFDAAPSFDLADLWHKYQDWIMAIFMLVLLLMGAGVNLLMQNRRIRQGEKRFATLFEHSPEALWIMLDRRFIDCNPAALRLFDFSDQTAMQGLSPLDISPEYQADGEASKTKIGRFLQVAEKGIQQSFEWAHLKTDGTPIICFIKLVPTRLNGKPTILCSAQDITAHRQMETALRESEYRWKFAVEGSGDGLWDWDIANNTTFFSRRWKDMIGFSDHELANHFESWEQQIHPDDKANVFNLLQDYFDGKIPVYSIEHRLCCKDGNYKWILARGIVVSRDNEGKPLRMIGTHTDISERKALETALRESEYRWKFAVEGSGDGLWDWDIANGTVFFSRQWKEMLGFTEDEIGNSLDEWEQRIHPDDKAKTMAVLQAYFDGKTPIYSDEHRVRCKDGSYKWILDRGIAVSRDNEDKPLRMIGTHTDISERKQLEDTREELLNRLQKIASRVPGMVYQYRLRADGSACFPFASEAMRDIYRVSPEEVREDAVKVFAILHPDDIDDIVASILDSARDLTPWHCEYRVKFADGTVHWLLGNAMPEREKDGSTLWHGFITDIGKRKQMEQALHDSNAFNISVLDSLTAQIAVLDAEGVIVAVNQAWRQFAKENGLPESAQAMLGGNYLQTCDDSGEANAAKNGILSVLNGEQNTFHLEYPCHSADQQRWFQMNVSALQGSRHGVVVSHENITERLEREHKLGLFHTLFELASDCMFLISAKQNSRFVFVNDATCRHFGATREQLLQWRIPDWDPNFKTEADLDAVWQKMRADKGWVLETLHHLTSGREVPVEVSVNYLSYNDDEYMAGYFHDISERKLKEEELKASEAKFRSIIEVSPVPMALNDDALNITFLNPAFVQTFGYTLADIPTLAAWWQKAYPDPDYRQWVKTSWQTSMETARREQAEFMPLELAICCKDNSLKTVMVTAAAINHDFSGVHLVMLYDISERKHIEAELTRSNAELEQFAYAVSHDMRQPLRMVSSYLALIEQALAGKLDEDTQQCLDFALNGAKRMDAMILSLLDYSRIGRVATDKIQTSSKAALDEALAFLGPEISACGGAVTANGDWPELVASPDELTRLLQNLIGNGLKYHRDGQPPAVEVHGEVRTKVLRVEVRDQGIGIAPGQMDRLFKVFSRLQARSRFEGTGVGLALCRKIVEHHGGSIGVESGGEGQGCVFWFELPL